MNPDLLKYDGIYYKITRHDLECDCFCSLASCEEGFFVDEIVVKTYSNLFHVKCMGKDAKIKKPEFSDNLS